MKNETKMKPLGQFWKFDFKILKKIILGLSAEFLVRCFKASDPRWGHVSIIDMLNSLNINFTGIHALENLFSVKIF